MKLQNSQFREFLDALFGEGWYVETLHLKSLFKVFHDDFFVAQVDKKCIGFITAIPYTDNFGFISNLVVLKNFRSQGYGKKLLEHALLHLGTRQVALESTNKQIPLYENYGFKAYYKVRYFKYTLKTVVQNTCKVSPSLNNKALFTYKQKMISSKFATSINEILKDENTLFEAIYTNKKIVAYGLSTHYKDGYKITLSAQNLQGIQTLFFKLIDEFKINTHIYLEVADTEKSLLDLVDVLDMKEDSIMDRMYNKVL